MKTKKMKLDLKKTTIATLDNSAKLAVKGGYLWTDLYHNCKTWYPQCPSYYPTVCSCPNTCRLCPLPIEPDTDIEK